MARKIIELCLLVFLFQGCAKTLVDENDFTLSNDGKTLEICIPQGGNLEKILENLNMIKIEEMVILGKIDGYNLAYLRRLSGGNDPDFLGGANLSVLNLKRCFFKSGYEVYYVREGEHLTIQTPSGIPAYAFENCYVLNTIILPNQIGNIYNINEGAFKDCLLLRYIDWGNQVRKIKQEAFMNCTTLSLGEPLVLPKGLTDIEDRAFKNTILHSIDIPSTIVNIGDEAFTQILGNVIIRSTIPPNITSTSFVFTNYSSKVLFVPEECIAKYEKEPYLSIFSEIRAI